jgi:hypothetical protein
MTARRVGRLWPSVLCAALPLFCLLLALVHPWGP